MISDLAYWWRAGWWSRLGVVAVAASIILIPPWLAYDYYTEPQRWAEYKAAHHCRLLYNPGEAGPTADNETNPYWVYDCDGGAISHRWP